MERDYAFEALAEATNTDWTAGRGELNAALKSIREQSEIEDSYLLADEIYARGKMYRAVFPNAALTPTALAKHWLRVKAETSKAPRHPAPAPLPPKPPKNVNLEHAREILAMLRSQE